MRVLAVDPGYDKLGIAVMEKIKAEETILHSECFSPSKKMREENRIMEIGKKIKDIIKKYSPEILALEELFFNKNQKTVMAVSEAKGVIIYEAVTAGLVIYKYTPLQVKIAVTGYGRSDKIQVTKMVRKIIRMEKAGPNTEDDEYDAIAVGLTFFAHHRTR
jgi:crossover junction endodeoxyribonuclease RuvC